MFDGSDNRRVLTIQSGVIIEVRRRFDHQY